MDRFFNKPVDQHESPRDKGGDAAVRAADYYDVMASSELVPITGYPASQPCNTSGRRYRLSRLPSSALFCTPAVAA